MNRITVPIISFLLGSVAMLVTALLIMAARPSTTEARVDQTLLSRSMPSLSAPQQDRARDIARHDADVSALIGDRATTFTGESAWTNSKGQLLGAVVGFRFTEPLVLRGWWRDLDYDCTEAASPPYGAARYEAQRSNVNGLAVVVDLHASRVASIDGDPHAHLDSIIQAPRLAHRASCND